MKLLRSCLAIAMLCTFLASTTASAATNHTGTFYNPAQDGHGLNIEELESGDLLVFWYTYRPDGTSMFLLAIVSGSDGKYSGDLFAYEGMMFGSFDPADNVASTFGTIMLDYNHCNSVDVSWTSVVDGFSDGATTMLRLTNVLQANCHNSRAAGTYNISMTSAAGIRTGTAYLLEDGSMTYTFADHLGNSFAGYGMWESAQGGFDFDTTFYPNNASDATDFAGTATFHDDGFVSVANGMQMQASMAPSGQNDLSSTDLVGSYGLSAGGFQLGTGTIDADGNFSADIFGCAIVGKTTIPDGNFNEFQIDTDTSGACPPGTIDGAGRLLGDGNLEFIGVETTNGTGYVLDLIRQ